MYNIFILISQRSRKVVKMTHG